MAGERKIRGCTPMQMRFVDESIALEFEVIPTGRTSHFLAAQRAGYQGNDETLYSTGSKLARNDAVKVEIDRRRVSARRANGLDATYFIAQMLELHELAKDDEKWSASISALSWAARIGGFVVDKIESKNLNISGSVDDLVKGLDIDELKALAATRIQEQLALKAGDGHEN